VILITSALNAEQAGVKHDSCRTLPLPPPLLLLLQRPAGLARRDKSRC